MATLFVLFATMNLLLGSGIAFLLHGGFVRLPWLENVTLANDEREENASEEDASPRSLDSIAAAGETQTIEQLTAETALPAPRTLQVEDIPPAWVEQLRLESVVCRSLVEASAEVLKLEVGKYREQLLDLEGQIQALAHEPEELRLRAKRIAALNEGWLVRQAEATSFLQAKSDETLAEISERLERVLLEQRAQIETTDTNLILFSLEENDVDLAARLRDEVGRCIDLAHALRDRMHETLLAIMKAEGRVGEMSRAFRTDGLTGLANWAGLEAIVHTWRKEDPTGQRLVSLAMLEVEKMGALNVRHGTRVGDKFLRSLAASLDGLLRKDRGFDVAAYTEGQTFVLFLGDTGPRGGTSAVERIRQATAVTEFRHSEGSIEFSMSCGVTELTAQDDLAAALLRLKKATKEAKKAGGHRTFLDEGYGPQPVESPFFQVKERIVPLAE